MSKIWTMAALTLLPIFLLAGTAAAVDTHKKAPGKVPTKPEARYVFDIDKLVWPNPPAIARVRYLKQLTGEKIDWAKFEDLKKKQKQGWMDRIAGDKPLEQRKDIKIPFQLIRVYGMAFDSKGKLYAADQGVSAIFVFDLETGAVDLIRNRTEASFGMITGLAIDDDDRIFASDTKLRHIAVLGPDHKQITSFGYGDMLSPAGMAIDTNNRLLYVVDTQRDQVMVYSPDTYKLLRTIGVYGKRHTLSGPGQFSLPTNAAVDSEGNLYVTDSVQQRVQVFDNTGRLLIYFGQPGSKPGQFNEAYGIAIDRKNRVAVSEQYIGRVQVFRYVSDAEAAALKAKKDAEGAPGTSPAPPSPSASSGIKGSGDAGKNP